MKTSLRKRRKSIILIINSLKDSRLRLKRLTLKGRRNRITPRF
jgi:hypothetical protein